jgi:hypothetical protein
MAIDAAIEAGVGIVESPPRYYEGSESGYSARSRPFERAHALSGGWKAVCLPCRSVLASLHSIALSCTDINFRPRSNEMMLRYELFYVSEEENQTESSFQTR